MDPVDIVVLKTCPMDADGYFNLSAANLWHRAVIERARDGDRRDEPADCPTCYGEQTGIHVSEVDYVIEGDDAPAPELPNPPVREVDAAAGRFIAAEIEDGDCLQIGIGGMPNAVCSLLLESGVRDLGVHTEMMIGRHRRPVQGRTDHRRQEAAESWQAGLHLRPRLAGPLRHARPQSRHALLSGGLHQRAAHHHAERPRGLDQQHHADRPAGTGGLGIRRSPPHQRHRRPAAVRARRLRVERRQVVHLPHVHLRQARRAPQPHRARA